MRVTVCWPPHVPSYFNAGHHLLVFLIAAYLRDHPDVDEVSTFDAGALNLTWKEIGEHLYQRCPDVLVIVNDFDNVDNFGRLIEYARELCPGVRVITGGRLSSQAPQPFRAYDVDAVVESGDVEYGVSVYVSALVDRSTGLAGVAVRVHDDEWVEAAGVGEFLSAERWRLPDIQEIPYDAYDRMYVRDQNKFCGIPGRRELVVPVARGCSIGCDFCEVPSYQGLRERRLSVQRTIAYVNDAFSKDSFEYVAFYAPTFTLNRAWVRDLCIELIEIGSPYPWKCTTTPTHLNEEMISLMSRAGCIRVSVGVETLEPSGRETLPRQKRTDMERFDRLSDACRTNGIELNCFVIAGLPGTTPAGFRSTVDQLRAANARIRPTMFSSIDTARQATDLVGLSRYTRQLLDEKLVPDACERSDWYQFLFESDPFITSVAENIPARR